MAKHIGRYEILSELGRGGFGNVYRAMDPTVGRLVAVKTLAAGGDPGMLTRFRNEAAASGRLRHPNIVTIFDFGEHEGLPYIVMELLEGQDLQHIIAERKPLSLLEKIQIMADIAAGLRHAHSHGVIHRDVKPANVMRLTDGTVKIMDFGIALVTHATHSRLTPRGAMVGTFSYMAPEQFRGAEPNERTDIFSYGLIFYELLSGVHPFHAREAATLMYNILSIDPVPLQEVFPECPAEVHGLVARLLVKDPDVRYQSLEDVTFDLDPALIALRRARAGQLTEEARAARDRGDWEQALTLVRQALELAPGHERGRALRAEVQKELRRQAIRPRVDELVEQGRQALESQKPAEAIERFESAIRLDPATEEARALLEEARLALERSREAARLADQAGKAAQAGDHAGAIQFARRALDLAPGLPDAAQVLARSEAALAKEKRAARLAAELAHARRLVDVRSWDEALRLLDALSSEFPEVLELGSLSKQARRGKAEEERQKLLAAELSAARDEFREGRLEHAETRLEQLAEQFPNSTEVQGMLAAVRSEIEVQRHRRFVARGLEEARAAASRQDFDAALKALDVALSHYPADPDLQRERRAIAARKREAVRRAQIAQALGEASRLRAAGEFAEALKPLEACLAAHGADPPVEELRNAILADQESARRSAELHAFVLRANELLSKGEVEAATRMLAAAPPHLEGDPQVTRLRDAAELQIRQQAERKRLLEEALSATQMFCRQEQFDEAFSALDAFERQHGADPRINEARRQAQGARLKAEEERRRAEQARLEAERARREAEQAREEAERRERERELAQQQQQAADELGARVRSLLPHDPEGASEVLAAAPEAVRGRAEIQALERSVERAVEDQRTRRAVDGIVQRVEELQGQQNLAAALRVLDEGLEKYPRQAELLRVREEVSKALKAHERERVRRDTFAKVKPLLEAHRYEEAALAVAGALVGDPSDEVLQRLRVEVEQQQSSWRAEQDLQESLARAHRLQAQNPSAAVALLESLAVSQPDREEVRVALAEAREALALDHRRRVLDEADRLAEREQFDSALARLASAGPDPSGEFAAARERIAARKEERDSRLAARAIQDASDLRDRDPRSALRSLQNIAEPLRSRPEVQRALEECRQAIVGFDRAAAIAAVEALLRDGKLAKARARHKEAAGKFGNDAALEALLARIEEASAPKPAPRPEAPIEVQPEPEFEAKAPRRRLVWAGLAGAVAGIVFIVIWALSNRPPEPPQTTASKTTLPQPSGTAASPATPPQAPPAAPAAKAKTKEPAPAKQQTTQPAPTSAPKPFIPPPDTGTKASEKQTETVATALPPPQIQVQAPGGLPPGGARGPELPPPPKPASGPKPAVPTPSPDVAAIEATLADFAAAFSNKNLDGVTSLWPTMPAAARNGLRDAFRNRDYSVLYSLQPVGAPVIQGDRAQIGARRTVEALLQPGNRRDRQGPTAVTVFLQKTGGRWVITDLQ